MPMLRGQRAKAIRAFQEQRWDQGVAYMCLAGQQSMPFVKNYKHLGGVMDFTLSLVPDVKLRAAAMRVELTALRRPIFSNAHVPLKVRATLLKTLVLSKALYLVGTWRELGVVESKAWRDAVSQALQAMILRKSDLDQGGRSLHVLCRMLGMPHPDALISLARIRLYVQLVNGGDACTRAMLAQDRSDNSWGNALVRDVRWIHRFLAVPDEASPLLNGFCWITQASGLLRCAKKAVELHATAQNASATEVCLEEDLVEPMVELRAPSFSCPACGAAFSTRRRLATHASRAHQIYSKPRFFIDCSNVCWACHQCFHTRKRAIYHIGQCSPTCLEFLVANYRPLEVKHVLELDSLTRRGGVHAGKSRTDESRRLVSPAEPGLRPALVALLPNEPPPPLPLLCSEDLPGPRSVAAETKASRLEKPL